MCLNCNSKVLIELNLSQYFGLHKLLTLFWRFFAQILVTLHEIVHVCAHNAQQVAVKIKTNILEG